MNEERTRLVRVEPREGWLEAAWGDGHVSRFHYVWLRSGLFFPSLQGEALRTGVPSFPDDASDLEPARIDAGPALTIHWRDGSTTRHEAAWLRAHCYSERERARRKHRPVLWDRSISNRFPTMAYGDVKGEEGLLALMRLVRDYGAARLVNVPPVPRTILDLASRCGYPQESELGKVADVKPDSKFNYGPTSATQALALHTDNNYSYAPPGICFFHCLESHGTGGATTLADGFKIAETLRERDADTFTLLTRLAFPYAITDGVGTDRRAFGRIINLGREGEIAGIRFSDRAIQALDLPEAEIEPAYRALGVFVRMLHDPELQVRFHMQRGDLTVFDNHRILHGRDYYDSASGRRHMQQAYIKREDFHSKLRMLAKAHGGTDADLELANGALGL